MVFFALAPLLSFAALVAAQADPSINSPASVVQCQPVQLSWTASRTPVIIPGGQAGAAALEDLGSQSGSSMTWTANIASGTSITIQLRDSTGAIAYSAAVTVQPSSDSSCLGAQGPGSSSAGGSSSSAAAGSSVSTPAGSTSSASAPVATTSAAGSSSVAAGSTTSHSATRPASSSTSRVATATSAQTSSTSSSNAAGSAAQIGWTGVMGFLAAAAGLAVA
ncbi:hypothetical protein CTheo_387 [Ceratobasidium theobromae]|uniref:Uncharacterized protein n=1 Tax=Ceratobasidium theobromae TaxID=1582974 RepID=A0A5N5QWK3_9AGAM|nr:hypothetical protein CTheo_387 [Ceratobasidium theobromae]